MAHWADAPSPEDRSALDALYVALCARKPSGWSVVRGLHELVVRPAARDVGKFGVTIGDGEVRAAFHDRRRGVWTAWQTWPAGGDVAGAMVTWAERLTADPDGAISP